MQVPGHPEVAGLLDRLVEEALPSRRGVAAWRALLRAHATLLRKLDTDLQQETGLALADCSDNPTAGSALRLTPGASGLGRGSGPCGAGRGAGGAGPGTGPG